MNFKKTLFFALMMIAGAQLINAIVQPGYESAQSNGDACSNASQCYCTCSCGPRAIDADDQLVAGNINGQAVCFCSAAHKRNFPKRDFCNNQIDR